MKTIKYEDWVEQYKPIKNNLNKNASMDGCMFETYDDELTRVFETDSKLVWTWITGENEEDWILPGKHLINRMGYFITEKPWEDENLEVDMNVHITIGKAKYSCVDFIEQHLNIELTGEQEDELHNFWSQIV